MGNSPYKVYVGDRERLQAAIAQYKAYKADSGKALKEMQTHIANERKTIAVCEVQVEKNRELLNNFSRKQLLKKENAEFEKCKLAYDECNDEITAMIDATCVQSENISYFLRLAQNIVPTVLKSVESAVKLDADFQTFYNFIERQCSDELTIETYFQKVRLSRFAPALAMEDYVVMEDLECDTKEDFKEILDILVSAVSEAEELPLSKKMSNLEIKKLKRQCLTEKDVWKNAQQTQTTATKRELSALSPVMILYFERLDSSLTKALKVLEFGSELNNAQEQVLAITAPKTPAISEETSKSDPNNNSGNTGVVELADDDSKQESYDDSSNHNSNSNSNNNTVTNAKYVSREVAETPAVEASGELAVSTHFQTAKEQNNQFCAFALRSIDVTSTMKEELDNCNNGKIFASGIQKTCEKFVQSQSDLRRNVAFAMEISKLKPAHKTAAAEKTWKSVNESIIHIYKSTIGVWKVSAEYFSFFSRFRQAFNRYLSCMEVDPNCDFVVSLDFLKRDINEFLKFKTKYNQVMMSLNDEATKCISNCVTNISGSQNYETATKNFDRAQKAYFVQIEILKNAEMAVDRKYCALKKTESLLKGTLAKSRYLLKTYQEMEHTMTQTDANAYCNAQIVRLQKELENANDYKTVWN